MQQAAAAPAPFDPQDMGTPESLWLQMLSGSHRWAPDTGQLLVVSPHPDDEILAAGGLIHAWARSGRDVTVVSVTDGEAAFPDWRGLGSVRRGELNRALRRLSHAHIRVIRVGIPDGRVSQYANRLRNALLDQMNSAVTMIAPYECDGHPDHEAVGQVCLRLARSHQLPIARYPVWTWHHTNPAVLSDRRWGRFCLSVEARRAKAHAVDCFASQLRPEADAPIVPPHVRAHFARPYEAFLL